MLASLPHEPMTSKIVLVRQHLAKLCLLGSAAEQTPDALLSVASQQAKMLAMPPGDVAGVMAPFVDVKQPKGNNGGLSGDKPPSEAGALPKGRPRAGQNQCTHCPVDLCKSTVWAKAKNDKNTKKYCLTHSMADPTQQLPHYQKTGPQAPTSSELVALKVCQEAVKRDPKIDLKNVSLSVLRKGNQGAAGADSGATAAGQQGQLTPMISSQALMGEAADQVTDPAEFGAWAAS